LSFVTKTTVQVPDERGGESNEEGNYVAIAVLIPVVVAVPALAHDGCGVSDKGAKCYEHSHGQSKNPVTLCLPEKAENGVHGDFHTTPQAGKREGSTQALPSRWRGVEEGDLADPRATA
jgi:hypothetical protein